MGTYDYVFKNISAIRKNKRIKQKYIAEKCGVVKSYISMIEAGKVQIPIGLLFDIASALEVHPQALLEDNEKRVFSHSFEGLTAYANELYKYHDSLKTMQAELDRLIEKYKAKVENEHKHVKFITTSKQD
jgi:transcriptional regulator with XRE-family HTH domain